MVVAMKFRVGPAWRRDSEGTPRELVPAMVRNCFDDTDEDPGIVGDVMHRAAENNIWGS
jgi:hypothetical protein